jgi:hypothetical protein
MTDDVAIAILVGVGAFMVGWVYFLARMGEPQSLWLLRDILGVM